MAPMMVDPHWFILKGAEKHKLKLEELERAEGSAQHARSAGFGGSSRWLWMTVWFVVAVAAAIVAFQVAVPSVPVLPNV
ncbi:MAG: hypothetical protein OXD46_09435 [Chloroflexi bacterium]|nr:hypothetical protein [Chloroflexota bacterium]